MRVRRLSALAVVALLGVSLCAAEDSDRVQRESRTLEEVARRLNALDDWLNAADKRIVDAQRAVATADRGIADVAAEIRNLRSRIDQSGEVVAALDAQSARLDKQRHRQQERLATEVRAAWRISGQEPLKVLLNQEDPAAIQRLIRYHGYFARARAESIAALRGTVEAETANRQSLHRERQSLAADRAALDAKRAALAAEREKRNTLLAALRSERSVKSSERDELAADRKRLRTLIDRLRQQAATRAQRQSASASDGDGSWPVAGRAIHRFGERRDSGSRWQGVYITAPAGTEVRAVASGEVVFAHWLRGFGLLAIVDHGNQWMSLYGHADALYKQVGDQVEGGETIAVVGQSGGLAEVGLYFEIRRDGEPTDPLAWLQRRANNREAAQ